MRRSWLQEWPTWLVVIAVYGGFGVLTWFHQALPWFLTLTLGGLLLAWHASLQHEILHGHPTGRQKVDTGLGAIPLSVWLPYVLYRASHLRHHRDRHLTCPLEDPESFYVTADAWNRLHPLSRWLLLVNQTLIGRLLIGPALVIGRFWLDEARRVRRGDRLRRRVWAIHLGLVALVLVWAIGIAGMPVWLYAGWVYLGVALLLLRSFAEHRAAPAPGQRTAVVDAAPLFGLLFLHNNLHVAHHARPGLAWYRLPAFARAIDARRTAASGAGLYRGYAEVARRHLTRPIDHPVHPAHTAAAMRAERDGRTRQRSRAVAS